jgi:hypothetical protein
MVGYGVLPALSELAGGSLSDVIELRVPPKLVHQSVARAAIGVIAGGLSFNYDEIIQLRVAVSEAFEIMFRRVQQTSPEASPLEVTIRFSTDEYSIEVLIPPWPSIPGYVATEEDAESQALLESLMDEVQLNSGIPGGPVIRMLKRREAHDD